MEIYNEQYYHNSCGPVPYEDPEQWTEFFGIVADRIIADFAPKTVLDAGCAMGYLVTALRDRGVEAYGIDISRYAISKVREDIKPFCVVGSLTDELPPELPKRFDLVTNIEVLEHLYAEEAVKAVHTLCGATDMVLFSSTPDDFTETTHVNVQQREYWARLFAQCGFFDNISYRPTYITSHAVCYRRQPDILRQVEDYERAIARCEQRLAKLDNAPWISKVYFDLGNGASEDSSISFASSGSIYFSQNIKIPRGCKSVRFDPVEGQGCLVWDVSARTESRTVSVAGCNGTQLGNVLVFGSNDPQIYFSDLERGNDWFEIKARIIPLDADGWLYLCEEIQKMENRNQQLLADISTAELRISELDDTRKSLEKRIDEEKQSVQMQNQENARKLDEQAAIFESDMETVQKELGAAQEEIAAKSAEILEYSRLVAYERQEAAKVAEAYRIISSSTFWKLTKPARVALDALKAVLKPIKKVVISLKMVGFRETVKKIRRKLSGQAETQYAQAAHGNGELQKKDQSQITGDPIDGIETVLVNEDVKRLNLVTDTIDASSLLGGVATALIVATAFANRYGYELRIITRKTAVNPVNYTNIMKISGLEPAKKLSFYSDHERFNKPVDFRMEISPTDLFFATSWWSAQAIKDTTIRQRFFYIIQEVEPFFYNYGSERLMCEQIMDNSNIDFIINSHYLRDYFAENNPNIISHGCYFEPAFPRELYSKRAFISRKRYKLFFYARPNNPRNLYAVGVEFLQKAVNRGILDLSEWDVYCVGHDAPIIRFAGGKSSINLGQLSWTEYAKFLSDVDLGLCLMYTPHPSYPPFDVASSGGVVLTNKMLNKQTFGMCGNVVMADLGEDSFLQGFEEAIALAKDMERRKKNYEESTIPRDWNETLEETLTFMGRACEIVQD